MGFMRCGAQVFQNSQRFFPAALHHQPAGAVGQEQHTHHKQHTGDGNHPEHPAPLGVVAEKRIADERHENANGNHELVGGDHGSTGVLTGNFRQVERGGKGRNANGQPHHGSSPDHAGHRPCQSAAQRADNENHTPRTSAHLRPVILASHPASTAPTAAPAIMALTIHSCAKVEA